MWQDRHVFVLTPTSSMLSTAKNAGRIVYVRVRGDAIRA